MGNQKQKWTAEEEKALLAGVAKHGTGKWKIILKDPEFMSSLTLRSNIDLKDKWRNLSVTITGASKEKPKHANPRNVAVRAPRVTPENSAPRVTSENEHSSVTLENSAPAASVRPNPSPVAVVDNAPDITAEAKRYNAMIFEALATMKDMNGSDIGAILKFIKQRHEMPIPKNFRRLLAGKLRKLASQGKLERVKNGYKIKKDATIGTKTPTPTPKRKDVRSRKFQNSGSITFTETVQDAADNAVDKLVEAENKFFLAAKALKEADRYSKMAEDTDAMLQLITEIYEQCSLGEVLAFA